MILIGAAAADDRCGADRTGEPGNATVNARTAVIAASTAYRRDCRDIGVPYGVTVSRWAR
ncbi:hypothetical protein GCM10027186_40360 [Micromonospora schwarzwaldensis]